MATRALSALGLAGCLFTSGCASLTAPPSDLNWTAERYARAVAVQDDQMDTFMVLRSQGPATHGPALATTYNDLRLNAAIDRKTLVPVVFVRLRVDHGGQRWWFPRSASYLDAAGEAVDAKEFKASKGDVRCPALNCSYEEGASFGVSVGELEAIVAAAKKPGASRYWGIRFRTEVGHLDYNMPTAEVEGLLSVLHSTLQIQMQKRQATARP